MKRNLWLLGSTLILASGCAKKDAATSGSVSSEEALTQMSAGGMDDALESTADDSVNSATGAASFEGGLVAAEGAIGLTATELTYSRTCTQASATDPVTVAVTLSGSRESTISKTRVSIASSIEHSGSLSRVWTPPSGQTIACNPNAKRVYLDWTNDSIVNGLSVAVSFDRSRTASRTTTFTRKGTQVETSDSFSAKGSRTATWATGGTSGGSVTRTKTVTSDVTRTRSFANAAGQSASIEMNVKTKSGAPLVIDVKRASSGLALQQKTIKSGTVVVTRTGKDRVETDFSNLVFDYSNSERCMPTSGSVSGRYYASADATEASATYTIEFGADNESGVSFTKDGVSAEFEAFSPWNCDLDQES